MTADFSLDKANIVRHRGSGIFLRVHVPHGLIIQPYSACSKHQRQFACLFIVTLEDIEKLAFTTSYTLVESSIPVELEF